MSDGYDRWKEWVHAQKWSQTDWPMEFWPLPDTAMGWFFNEKRKHDALFLEVGHRALVAMEAESDFGLDARRDLQVDYPRRQT